MRTRLICSVILPLTLAGTGVGGATARSRDGGPTGAFVYARDPAVASVQRDAKRFVETYQKNLNSGNTEAIVAQFAPDAVSEWNDKATVIGNRALAAPYRAIFATTKFSTDFQFDAVDVHGDLAIVRTHHPIGQVEVSKTTGKRTPDFNREIFVLRRTGPSWQIILYSFNTQPKQGEQ